MKEMEIKNLKRLSEFLHLKQTITQLLISVSIISLVFSLSSSTLLYNQNLHYFSSNSFHPMSIAMNKNYIFLIFNGILVFLAKTSTLAPPPSASDPDDDMLHKGIIANHDFQVEITEAETLISDKHIALDENSPLATEKNEDEGKDEDEDEENEDEDAKVEEREDQEFEHSNESTAVQVMIAIDDGSEDDENELQNCCLYNGRDEEGSNGGEEEAEEIEKLSNEVLNKKFEDFIKRMKEEFRINQYQQKQLVLVK